MYFTHIYFVEILKKYIYIYIYVLPKIHCTMSWVDQFQTAGFTLTIYLHFWTTICNHLLSYIKDTNHFLNKLKKIGKLPEGEILCTMDVVGLYPNIPHWEGLASLYKLLETRDNKQILSDTLEKWYMEKVLPLSISFWKLGRTNILSDTLAELVEIVSKNNIFELTN